MFFIMTILKLVCSKFNWHRDAPGHHSPSFINPLKQMDLCLMHNLTQNKRRWHQKTPVSVSGFSKRTIPASLFDKSTCFGSTIAPRVRLEWTRFDRPLCLDHCDTDWINCCEYSRGLMSCSSWSSLYSYTGPRWREWVWTTVSKSS